MNKFIMMMVALLLMVAEAKALDLMLRNGQVLNDVTILNRTPHGVNISANQGNSITILREVPYASLTAESMRQLQNYLTQSALELGNTPYSNMNSMMNSGSVGSMMGNNTGMGNMTNSMMNNQLVTVPQGLSYTANGQSVSSSQQVDNSGMSMSPMMIHTPMHGILPPNAQPYPNTVQLNPGPNTPIILPGMPHRVYFTSIIVLLNGSLGWARSADPGVDMPLSYGEIYIYGILVPQGGIWIGNVYPTGKNILHRGQFYPCYATNIELARRISAVPQY